MDRMTEGIRLIRQMWDSKEPFKFEGKYFSSGFYCLYTKPRRKIPIYASAIGRKAAYAAGANTEGLITLSPRNDVQRLKDVILPAYMQGRRETNKKGLGKVAIELIHRLRDARISSQERVENTWHLEKRFLEYA